MTRRSYFSLKLIIPAVAAGVSIVILLSPVSSDGRYGDPRLSTSVTGPLGARGLMEGLARLGWRAERQITPGFASVDSATIVAVLAPHVALSERETGLLLDRIRSGGSLLAVIENGTPLADSLRVATAGSLTVAPMADTATGCPPGETRSSLRFLRGKLYATPFHPRRTLPEGTVTFLSADNPALRGVRIPLAIGFPFGRGRIAAVSDANLLRNDVIRVCQWDAGLAVVRMAEYLSAGSAAPKRRIIFDEFHQGFGPQPDLSRAITRVLTRTAPGQAIAQMALAAIVLLAAVAPRPISPQPRTRIERRSPFEHVDALASAYLQANATQLAVQRLVRGLKRRMAVGTLDADFLDSISRAHPELSADVAVVQRALAATSGSDGLVAAGRSIEHIERVVIK